MLAERAGISRVTLRKVENGEGSVTIAIYANVLFCLGLERDLLRLAEDDPAWLKSSYVQVLDPGLTLFSGPQYARDGHDDFGVFLDSCPDRWGRVLMQRREAQHAKAEERNARPLLESD